MAVTQISDVVVPSVFAPYVIERTATLSALWQSGVVAPVPGLNLNGAQGGFQINMPFWQDLTGSDEVLSDSGSLTPAKITAARDISVLHARGKAWSTNDLAKALSGDDPMRAIGDLVAAYWARRMQDLLISTLKGAFLGTNMSGLVHDISAESGDAAVIGGETTIDAMQKLGDAKGKLTAFAMHSAVEAKLAKDDMIVYEKDSTGSPVVPTYLGKRVIVDDSMPVSSGTYTSYLFGEGAIGYGEGNAPVPVETDRDSLAGNDILINRRHFVLHPRGVKWLGASVAGDAPTNTEAETAANWERAYEAKNIRIVQFKHKIA
jgi:hypothetical protein